MELSEKPTVEVINSIDDTLSRQRLIGMGRVGVNESLLPGYNGHNATPLHSNSFADVSERAYANEDLNSSFIYEHMALDRYSNYKVNPKRKAYYQRRLRQQEFKMLSDHLTFRSMSVKAAPINRYVPPQIGMTNPRIEMHQFSSNQHERQQPIVRNQNHFLKRRNTHDEMRRNISETPENIKKERKESFNLNFPDESDTNSIPPTFQECEGQPGFTQNQELRDRQYFSKQST